MEEGRLQVCREEERLLVATIAQHCAVLAVEGPCTILVQLLCYIQLSVPTSFVPRPHHHALFDCQYAIRINLKNGRAGTFYHVIDVNVYRSGEWVFSNFEVVSYRVWQAGVNKVYTHSLVGTKNMCCVSLVRTSSHPAFYVGIIHIMNVSGLAILVSVL